MMAAMMLNLLWLAIKYIYKAARERDRYIKMGKMNQCNEAMNQSNNVYARNTYINIDISINITFDIK